MTKIIKTTTKQSVEAKQTTVTNLVEVNNLYKSIKDINEAIDKAIFKGTSLQNEYQKIACSVIAHLKAHKDIRLVRHFLDTLPKSLRKDSMEAFIDRFGAVSVDDKGVFHYNKERKADLEGAIKLAWWKAKKQGEYKPFNLLDNLNRIIKRAEKRLADGVDVDKGDFVTEAQIEQLNAIANTLEKELETTQVDTAIAA